MRLHLARSAFAVLVGIAVLSCSEIAPTAPQRVVALPGGLLARLTGPSVVITQVYGGGGNSGAKYKNDFVEIYNRGTAPVSLNGWSIQYGAAGSTTGWQVTALTNMMLQPGQYYLVQEAVGNNTAADPLPTADVSGGIPMSANNGRVALVSSVTPLITATGVCSSGASSIVDLVSYGATNCSPKSTAALAANTSAIRSDPCAAYNDNSALTFTLNTPPTPRNSATPIVACAMSVTPLSVTLVPTETQQFAATGNDANGNPLTSFTWSSDAPGVATVGQSSGLVTGVGGGTATITATASNGATATASVTVVVPVSITLSPDPAAVEIGTTVSFTALARDASNTQVFPRLAWNSSATAVATVDLSGVATGVTQGSATITARAANGVSGSVTLGVTTPPPTDIVISQIYAGGGNSGAPLKNDYIELFNRGSVPANLNGWSVQYASATNATPTWQATALSNVVLQPGHYYLIQEAAGTGTAAALPTPDVSGGINMGATGGKVVLVKSTTLLTGVCPTGGSIVDRVGYGSTNCDETWGAGTAPTSNSTAAFRKGGGCVSTGLQNNAGDFIVGAPKPRNTSSATRACVAGVLDHVALTGATSVFVDGTTTLTASAQDGFDDVVPGATVTWSSNNPAVATVSSTGEVAGIAVSATPVTITATAVDGPITKTASIDMNVTRAEIHWLDVGYSSTGLVAGFQAQMFLTARVAAGGQIIPATYVVEALDPDIAIAIARPNATIVQAVAAPTDPNTRPRFKITATPTVGGPSYEFTTGTSTSVPVLAPVAAPTSIYATNDEFGDPTPATEESTDDQLIVRPQYTLSYNQSRGTPNWVAYELDSRHIFFGEDRCNCFTADPHLPANKQIFTSDYTNGGYDRGHMTRSVDRTAANVDNATTFYLTNVVPQLAALNQGVWAHFENALGDSATKGGRAVYIITGPLYTSSPLKFLKNEGKVAIPDATWKVALIGPRNGGVPFNRANIQTWDALAGLTLLAVVMPNSSDASDPWQQYVTTVDKLEDATGFDFLSLLPIAFQTAVEAGDRPPVANFSFSGTLKEGAPVTFDAAASTDPDLGRTDLGRTEALAYTWQFSDGTTASGKTVTKTFADNGEFTAALVVSDAFGWEKTLTKSVAIANVAPTIAAFDGAALIVGERYTANGAFTDPGADTWTATVSYVASAEPLDLSGMNFTLSHTYTTAGNYTVTVSVVDDDGGVGTKSATVNVVTSAAAIEILADRVAALAIQKGEAAALDASLRNALKSLGKENGTPARNQLRAFIDKVTAMQQSGRLDAANAAALISYAQRIVASI